LVAGLDSPILAIEHCDQTTPDGDITVLSVPVT